MPDPVWKMSTTKWSSHRPSATSRAADCIASDTGASSRPRSALTLAADSFISPRARMNPRENRRSLMGKFSWALRVEAP